MDPGFGESDWGLFPEVLLEEASRSCYSGAEGIGLAVPIADDVAVGILDSGFWIFD
jgi:hypothetical protein